MEDVADRWRDPEWLAGAMTWVDQRLAEAGRPRSGEPDQVHVRAWGTAIKVPTDRGPTWFKATTEDLVHETLVTHLVSQRVPEREIGRAHV